MNGINGDFVQVPEVPRNPSLNNSQSASSQPGESESANFYFASNPLPSPRNVVPTTSTFPSISTISFNTPAFWRNAPKFWFKKLEAQFELARISTETTKYNHLLSALDENLIRVISDVLESPDPRLPYTQLKDALISRLSDSETSKLNKLLGDLVLGDRSPSQFLREMRNLSDGNLSDDVLKTLWLQRLPDHMRAILSCNPGPLSQLADCADKIFEISNKPSVFTLSSHHDNKVINILTNLSSEMFRLNQSVDNMALEIKSLKFRDRSSSNSSLRNFQHSRGRSPSRNQIKFTERNNSKCRDNPDWCWYHDKFKINAAKCIPPCSFKRDFPDSPKK